jgi:hypothetical protein
MRVRRSHSSDRWSVVPKMRREGGPDPGISLGDQSAVVKSLIVKYERLLAGAASMNAFVKPGVLFFSLAPR